jgi:predicted outer membrane repeat protein
MRTVIFLALGLLLAPFAAAQTTWYVDVNAPPPGDGTQASPYQSIQYAIAQPATLSGDTLLVLPGTYTEKIDYLGKSLAIESSAGPSATLLQGQPTDLVSLVRVSSGEGPGTRLRGFRLEDGQGTIAFATHRGGAIDLAFSQLEVQDCRFADNGLVSFSFVEGGAIAAASATLVVEDCLFERNGSSSAGPLALIGGAISLANCQVQLRRCRFENNGAQGRGGAIYAVSSDVNMAECILRQNVSAGGEGGGVYAQASALDCQNVVWHKNRTLDGHGGGLYVVESGATLRGCLFTANVAGAGIGNPHRGGGIYATSNHGLLVEDGFFSDNRSAGGAGAYSNSAGASFVRCRFEYNFSDHGQALDGNGAGLLAHAPASAVRCSFRGNVANSQGPGGCSGGGVFGAALVHCVLTGNSVGGVLPPYPGAAASNCTLSNCIVWDNQTQGAASILGGTSAATFSLVQGGFPGPGNFSADPLWWNPPQGDFGLQAGSPCIDAGDPTSPPDPDGSAADLGLLPYSAGYAGGPATYCTAKANSAGCLPIIGHNAALPSSSSGAFQTWAVRIVSDKTGLLFWGGAPAALPFLGGTLCVQPPLTRTAVQASGGCQSGAFGCGTADDCSGTFHFSWTAAYLSGQGLGAGSSVYNQFWYRDPADPLTVGLSNALSFVLYP